MKNYKGGRFEFYDGVGFAAGDMKLKEEDVSISSGFRNAKFHAILPVPDEELNEFYKISPNSYFSESAMNMDGFK